jgi:excisionase family DNA binding protein
MAIACEQKLRMAMATENGVWFSYTEAQRFCGLGHTKLWEIISTGEVEAVKVGRAVRISRRSLDEYIKRSAYTESKGVIDWTGAVSLITPLRSKKSRVHRPVPRTQM